MLRTKFIADTIKIAAFHARETPKAKFRGRITKDSLTQYERFMATVCLMAYHYANDPEKLQDRLLDGDIEYLLMRQYSDSTSVVYVNRSTNSAIIGYRGTLQYNVGDYTADAMITIGRFETSSRFRSALAKYYLVRNHYSNIILTGHSLGGTKAVSVGKWTNTTVYAFAPAQGINLRDIVKGLNKYPNIHTYHISGDPVSLFCGLECMENNNRFDPPMETMGMLARHSLHTFLKPPDVENT
jgi:hypothetical protein